MTLEEARKIVYAGWEPVPIEPVLTALEDANTTERCKRLMLDEYQRLERRDRNREIIAQALVTLGWLNSETKTPVQAGHAPLPAEQTPPGS
jgi:hypothetical protein